ncbi:hypothetical protein PVAG01_04842 [Phlyctema vagabunda]|uniref:Celp0028 effector like protein n=1 Tax=Phlyctema vagabunda TaxID=108571 RepID=A0ABR4PIG7_9HELO
MQTTIFASLLSASLISAAAVPTVRSTSPRAYLPTNGTEANITVLDPHDIILYGKDRVEIMNKSKYLELKSQYVDVNTDAPSTYTNSSLYPVINSTTVPAKYLKSRADCKSHEIYTPYPTQKFLNWDVLMSSIVHATGSTTTVAVTEGYTIGNSLSVSTGFGAQLTEALSITASIDYTQTWSSSYSVSYTYGVPYGKYGAVVSNPQVTRESGRIDVGCIGEPSQSIEYQADSYTSHGFSELNWVDGVISLCLGDTFPLERCLGEGTFT